MSMVPSRTVRVNVNLFKVTKLPVQPFAQYDTVISSKAKPDKELPRITKQDVVNQLALAHAQQFPEGIIFDGEKNAWVLIPRSASIDVDFTGTYLISFSQGRRQGEAYTVKLPRTSIINNSYLNEALTGKHVQSSQNPNVLNSIMLLQQILLSGPKADQGFKNGRSFFPSQYAPSGIGHALLAYKGLFQSVRPTVHSVMINIDTTTRAGYAPGRLADLALELLPRDARNRRTLEGNRVDPRIWRQLRAFYYKVKVIVKYQGCTQKERARPIQSLILQAGLHEFEKTLEDGSVQMMTVEQYYRDKGVILQYPRLFGVRLGSTTIVPAELCYVAPHQLLKAKVQAPRTEMIAELRSMTIDHLHTYLKRNKFQPPGAIVYFRDGVSEGEFEKVVAIELPALRGAVEDVWNEIPRGTARPPKPFITIIVVGKRHHVRIFPTNVAPRDNCEPGVVVDEAIQSPYAKDWYSISQGGLKGTSVPAHYVLLHNENAEWDMPTLQQASYALCYSYHRATRSASIPAPVYYADLACTYVEFQSTENLDNADTMTISSSHHSEPNLQDWTDKFKPINPRLRERFYFL